ncbi:hypothetical protein Calab_0539 [Caldithrix abyssi DSM 13497]|uniref:Uncharacterized protein n=1 Tax=Caldithrix abyssi DSM 13497 TaxID=880073 RepID=H1XRN0_CALAY|nr:hypothetical protein Calab_0539 [Caldithrix abyssi DSM 13497]
MSSSQKARHVISNEVRNLLTPIKNDLALKSRICHPGLLSLPCHSDPALEEEDAQFVFKEFLGLTRKL